MMKRGVKVVKSKLALIFVASVIFGAVFAQQTQIIPESLDKLDCWYCPSQYANRPREECLACCAAECPDEDSRNDCVRRCRYQ